MEYWEIKGSCALKLLRLFHWLIYTLVRSRNPVLCLIEYSISGWDSQRIIYIQKMLAGIIVDHTKHTLLGRGFRTKQ